MPWKVTCVMNQRMKFVAACLAGEESMAELCRQFGISRKTGYKLLGRYERQGPSGLADRSRAPHRSANAIGEVMQSLLLNSRAAHPTWGPRKLLAYLQRTEQRAEWPAPSTVGDLLRRHGLVVVRRRRRRPTATPTDLQIPSAANQLWCADFKGWFRTGNGRRCTPLTVTDAHSRFLLRCQALGLRTHEGLVRPIFEATFREYGMPLAIRTDNGPPFASLGLGGLSALSVWWIRLGITPERIPPGHPEHNGRHERMHRTLKAETAKPPAQTRQAQQRRFDAFRREYNEVRPHQAIGLQCPAQLFSLSPRSYPSRLEEIAYCDDWETRAVRGCGQMKWAGHDVRISAALIGQRIGLEPVDDGLWRIYFAHLALGLFDERRLKVIPIKELKKTD
jgi:transposase InsO family protein